MDNYSKRLLSTQVRRIVLQELLQMKKGNAYQIAKNTGISDAAVSKHLKILMGAGLVKEPDLDISEGRLKKIYQPTENAENLLTEYWLQEFASIPINIKKKILHTYENIR